MMEQSPALGFWDKSSEDHLRSRFPVHRACRDGDTGALSALLAHGEYDLYTEDQFYGWTPAHWSAYHGKLGCLQLLVTAGVNFDVATQRFHQTPAHVAAFGNQPHCLMWLIRSGASVNAQDYLGETPAHKAARSGGIECLGILKANGAVFRTINNNGHLPKDLALSCSHELCAHYIQQVDGVPRIPNGYSSGHLGRKRGPDDTTNGDLKKARTENGSTSFEEDHNGTENMEMNLGSVEDSHKPPCGQHSCSGQQSSFGQVSSSGQELCVGQPLGFGQQSHNGQQSCMDQQLNIGQQGNGSHQPSIGHQPSASLQSHFGQQASGDPLNGAISGPSKDSPSQNGLSVDCPAPHHPNCSNGGQGTPTPCMNLPHPQETTPRTLQASEIVSLHTEAGLGLMECQHNDGSRMETDNGQENGHSNKIDLSVHHSGVVNGQRALSGSELEHNATVNQEVDYNRLYDSIYTTVNYCHFF